MSFPTIPNITPSINITAGETVNLLLASIAFEELGLAHLINAEAEKIQYILGTLPDQSPARPPTFEELIEMDVSVIHTLRTIIKAQMLLQFKLEDIITMSTSSTTSTSSSTTTSASTTTCTTTCYCC